MGFKDKLIKKTNFSSPRAASGGSSTGEPREYYPKSIGIYCEDNPKVDRRSIRPYVIGSKPPAHKTTNIEFKGNTFSATPVWYGKLFAEPIVVNMGYYPVAALFPETDELIFPTSFNDYDKKIPIIKESGIDIPLEYDLLTSVVSERKRLSGILLKNLSDKGRAKVEKDLAALKDKADDEKTRTRHEVKILPKIFIPVMMSIVTEELDSEGELETIYTPKLVIFEETMGIKKAKSLVANKIIEEASDIGGMLDYLYEDILEAKGEPILLFRNSLAAEGKDSIPPIAAKKYEDKIPKALLPFFDIVESPNITDVDLLRIIVLEMIGLFAPKGDTSSIEGKLKEYFWSQVQKEEK